MNRTAPASRAAVVLLIAGSASLSGCVMIPAEPPERSSFVGEWISDSDAGVLVLSGDGTATIENVPREVIDLELTDGEGIAYPTRVSASGYWSFVQCRQSGQAFLDSGWCITTSMSDRELAVLVDGDRLQIRYGDVDAGTFYTLERQS